MICPICDGELILGGGEITSMGFSKHFDDDGVVHSHDPNTTTGIGRCHKGHRWSIFGTVACPVKGCDYGSTHLTPAVALNPKDTTP